MPNGGVGLGERLAGWFEKLPLVVVVRWLVEYGRKSREQWAAIDSLEDLQQYARDYPGRSPGIFAHRARELGATDEEVATINNPQLSEAITDPSAWIASLMHKAAALPAWHEFNEIMGALVFDPWLASIVGGKLDPRSPELENVRRFLGTQATFETLGTVMSMLGETISAGQVENAGKMFTDAKWLLGTCFTSWQSTSPIVQAVILSPLQRLVNLTFREADFTRSQWMDLYDLGKIGATRLGAELGRLGFDSEKIAWLLDLAEKQPSRGDLVGMWKKGIISDTIIADGFRRLGYDQVWIDRFLTYYRKEETSEEKGAYLGTLRKALKEQLISEGDFREALKTQGRSDVAIDLEIAVLKLSWEVEEKTAAKSDIRSAYMENVIGRPEAEKWLANADFASHTIVLLLTTWDKEKAPTYRQINKSELLKAWATGVLSQPQVFQGLIDVGYDDRGATVLMETYRRGHMQTKPPDVYELRPQDVMWAWHAEVIEEGEVIDRLLALGFIDEDAGLLFETFQRLHPRVIATPPRELKKNDILEAWGRGVLTEEVTFGKLVGIDYTEEDASVLMTSYAARPEALPPEPTIAALIGATRRGVIDQAQLSQKLTVMGLKAEDVQFYVSYATTPLPEKTRSLSRSDVTKLWTEGRHDRAWALERLLALNYAPEDAEDILWLASPEIGDTETYVLWVAGFVEDHVARAMWATMGFTPEQINEVLGEEQTI